MDNQFKNLKTYARLSSKAIWYDWRKKLLDDLKGGLSRIQDDMTTDDEMLVKYEKLLSSLLPRLVEIHELLRQERERLQAQADEIARSDQEELSNARSSLMAIKREIEEKRDLVEQKRMQIREKQEKIEVAIENKMTAMEEIKEAERIKEECRGWSASEVRMQKGTGFICFRMRTRLLTMDRHRGQPGERLRLDYRRHQGCNHHDDLSTRASAFIRHFNFNEAC